MNNNRTKEIQFMIEKANHILTSNDIKKIQENDDFTEGELSHEGYVVYTLRKDNCIELRLEFSSDGVDIGINDFYEVHSLGFEEIANDSSRYEEYLNDLFFKRIIIEKCSFGLTCYYAKDACGQIELFRKIRFGLIGMLFFFLPNYRILCKSIECRPIYRQNDKNSIPAC